MQTQNDMYCIIHATKFDWTARINLLWS